MGKRGQDNRVRRNGTADRQHLCHRWRGMPHCKIQARWKHYGKSSSSMFRYIYRHISGKCRISERQHHIQYSGGTALPGRRNRKGLLAYGRHQQQTWNVIQRGMQPAQIAATCAGYTLHKQHQCRIGTRYRQEDVPLFCRDRGRMGNGNTGRDQDRTDHEPGLQRCSTGTDSWAQRLLHCRAARQTYGAGFSVKHL